MNGCHQIPERSFFFRGRQFPVCARCTGIYIGNLALPLFLFNFWDFNLMTCTLLILPSYSDWWMQYFFGKKSNNYLRVITGFFAGVGLVGMGVELADILLIYFKT